MLQRIVLLAMLLPLAGCVFPQDEDVVYIEPDWTYADAPDETDDPSSVVTAPTVDR